jgi:hypothetical protein
MNSYLVSFATPKQSNKQFFELIANLYVLDRAHIDIEKIAQNLTLLKLNKPYSLYIIDSESDPNVEVVEIPSNEKTLVTYTMKPETFFDQKSINLFINKLWDKETNTIFIFRNTKWKNLVYQFNILNIRVSGGTKSKRQISTPQNAKLVLFTWAIEGSNTIEEIARSYHSTVAFHTEKDKTQPIHDFTSKEVRNKISEHLEGVGSSLPTELPLDRTEDVAKIFDISKKENVQLSYADSKSLNAEDTDKTNNNDPSSISFGIKGQSRKFHSSTINKSEEPSTENKQTISDILGLEWKEFIFSIEMVEKFVDNPIELAMDKFNENIKDEVADNVLWIKNFKIKTKTGETKLDKEITKDDIITHVIITYIILDYDYFIYIQDKITNLKKGSDKPSNGDKKGYHTISILKDNSPKLSDRIPASVYKSINLTPHPEQSKGFTTITNQQNDDFKNKYLNTTSDTFYLDLISYRHKDNSLGGFIKNYINNPLYLNIKLVLDNDDLKTSQKQFRLEESLTDFWRKEIVDLFRNNQKLFRSEYGIKMIYGNIEKLDRDLQDLKKDKRSLKGKNYKNLLMLMSNPDIVSIVLCNIIPFCIKFDSVLNQNVIGLFEKVGKEIEKVFYRNEWFKYKKRNKKEWNDKTDTVLNNYYIVDIKNHEIKITDSSDNCGIIFESKLSENDFINKLRSVIGVLTEEDHLKLGLDLIEFISAKSSLFTVENKRVDKETLKRYILPGFNLKSHILDIITYDSDLTPMINKPESWVIEKGKKDDKFYIKKYGGFISNKNNKKHYLKKSNKHIGPSKINNLDIINTINYLSSIKYCVNINLLKIIFDLLDKNDDRINKLIKTNLHSKTNEIFDLSNNKDKQIELYEILKYNSQYYRDRTVLHLVLLFSKWCSNPNNSIYFPLFVDWRGRLLTNTGSFSYQQGELARSLILFREGQILNKSGLESLKIYTANCFGKDKLTYNNRLTWVDENIDSITNLNIDFIFEADEPLLFLSCCLELKGCFNDPDNFVSRLPIYKDATCNG